MPHQVVEFDGIPQRPAEHRPLAGDGRVGGGLPVEPEGQQIKRSPYERRLRELRERETIRPEPCVDPDLLLRHRISVRRVERPLVESAPDHLRRRRTLYRWAFNTANRNAMPE